VTTPGNAVVAGWVPYAVGVPLIPALLTAFITGVSWPFPLNVFHSVSLVLWRYLHAHAPAFSSAYQHSCADDPRVARMFGA